MKTTLQLGAMSAVNIGAQIGFQWLTLTLLGPTAQSDALFAAMTIPQLFASVISVSLTNVLTPLLAGEPDADQHRDAWTLLLLCGGLFVVLALLLALTAAYWVPWTVPGFSPANQALTITLSRVTLIGMIFTGINAVQSAAAFARGRYLWVDAAPAIASVVAVALLPFLLGRYGVIAAAALMSGRVAVQSLLMLRGMGAPVRPSLDRPIVQQGWRRLVPLLVGASYYKMDPVVDRLLLSTLPPGSLSLFYLAQQLWGAGAQVIGKALGIPAITRLSIAHKRGDSVAFRSDLRRTAGIMLLLSMIVVAGLVTVGRPILTGLLTFGAFRHQDGATLWWLLVLSSGMFVAGALGALAAGGAYAVGDTRRPTILGSISFTIGIFIKVLMFFWFGIAGLAIAVSIYYGLSFVLLWSLVSRDALRETPGSLTGPAIGEKIE